MDKSFSESYKAAGVDITAGYKSVEMMKGAVRATFDEGVLSDIGGFGGLYRPNLGGMSEPILVSGTDGVGTKLKLAFLLDKHGTIGQDCVAMCVNDIVCVGAKPLFFLDYIALGKNVPEKVAEIVGGVAEGCSLAGCSLIGGETAEMPGFYPEDEYDLAGFAVGIVDRGKMLNNENVRPKDKVIGIASSGLHSNGFSLVRKVFGKLEVRSEEFIASDTPDVRVAHELKLEVGGGGQKGQLRWVDEYREELGETLGDNLLRPTRIYVKQILKLIEEVSVKSISNITGGGFYENIPRALNERVSVRIDKNAYEVPNIFRLIQEEGGISKRDMYNTFNMGIGMVVIVGSEEADRAVEVLRGEGEEAWVIGDVVEGEREVIIV